MAGCSRNNWAGAWRSIERGTNLRRQALLWSRKELSISRHGTLAHEGGEEDRVIKQGEIFM